MAYLLDAPFATALDFGSTGTGLWLYKPAAAAVPEPATLALLGIALTGFALGRGRRAARSSTGV